MSEINQHHENNPDGDILTKFQLEAISVIDGRYHKEVSPLRSYVSEFGLIRTRAEIESKYLIALSNVGILRPFTDSEEQLLNEVGQEMTLDQAKRVKELEKTSEHDVKAVENWLREHLKNTSLSDITSYIHFLLTSEDVNNLSYRLMFQRATQDVMVPSYDRVIDRVMEMAVDEKNTVMLARTHGQDAVPTTLGKEMAIFAARMNREVRKLANMRLTGKFNGAAGNFNAHKYARPEIDWNEFSRKFVESFGLSYNPFSTQINPYEDMIESFQSYQRLNGVVLDADQDIWRYISDNWLVQEVRKTTTGSSTMPQKVNPIDFENSEGNVAVGNGLFEAMGRKLSTSRLQRDLSDSTTIRNIGAALAHSLLVSEKIYKGLGKIHANHAVISEDVGSNWSVLAEGVQTVLRDNGRDDAYDVIKDASKGEEINASNWLEWIDRLDIAEEEKERFRKLSPQVYIGNAAQIVDMVQEEIESSRN